MKNYLILTVLVFALAACGGKKENKESSNDLKAEYKKGKKSTNIKKELIGRWRNSDIKVTMKTEKGDSTLTATGKNWQEILNIKPIVTTFSKNGSFKSVYRDLDNKVIMTSDGTWKVDKDSLYMTQDNKTTSYHVSIKKDVASFKGVLDWDQDGEKDDIYYGRQSKIVKKKEETK